MKKIAHIVATGEYSGAEKIVIEICQYLKDDYDFVYVCRPGGIEEYLKAKRITYKLYNSTRELISILRKNDFDIVHAHDYTASVLSGFFFKRKVISHIHSNAPFSKTLNLKSSIHYLSTIRVSKILCVSNSIMNEMYFKNRIGNKLKVAYNWVNTEERYWKEDLTKNIDVLFIGRFSDEKNPFLFLEVIKKLKDNGLKNIIVKMIGRGKLKEDISEYINKNNLDKNIEVLDFTDKPHKYMKESKVFFVPSKWEGFGLVFVEALINDCAVVATPVGGIKEIFKGDLSYLSYDKEKLVTIIEKLLLDNNYRKCNIYKKNEILNRFDMSKNIDVFREYY